MIGVVAGVALLAALLFFLLRRRRSSKATHRPLAELDHDGESKGGLESTQSYEVHADAKPIAEVENTPARAELPSPQDEPVELDAGSQFERDRKR